MAQLHRSGKPAVAHRIALIALLIGCALLNARALALPAKGPALSGSRAAPPQAFDVGVTEYRGNQVPLDLSFTDEQGQAVKLAQYFASKRPVVLQLGYFQCPQLCDEVAQGLVNSVRQTELKVGQDIDVLVVSINPKETAHEAAAKKANFVQALGAGHNAAGWHALVGQQDQIVKLAQAVGFEYRYIPEADEYSHPAVIILLTPDGRVSRYLYTTKYDPKTLRRSLVEASDGKIGSAMDQVILVCFQWDSSQGKYVVAAVNVMKIGGGLTLLLVGSSIGLLFWRERRRRHSQETAPKPAANG